MQENPKLHVYSPEGTYRATSHLHFDDYVTMSSSLQIHRERPIAFLRVPENGLSISARFALEPDNTEYSVHTILEIGDSSAGYYQNLLSLKVYNDYGNLSAACSVWPSADVLGAGVDVEEFTVNGNLHSQPGEWNQVTCNLHTEIQGEKLGSTDCACQWQCLIHFTNSNLMKCRSRPSRKSQF